MSINDLPLLVYGQDSAVIRERMYDDSCILSCLDNLIQIAYSTVLYRPCEGAVNPDSFVLNAGESALKLKSKLISGKIKNEKKVIMPYDWTEVTTEVEIQKSKISFVAHSAEILGLNDVLYGYLVYRAGDLVNILTIDENTIRLYYHYIRTSKD